LVVRPNRQNNVLAKPFGRVLLCGNFYETRTTRHHHYVFSSPIRPPLREGVRALERGSVLETKSPASSRISFGTVFRTFIDAKRESASEEGNTQEIGEFK
jgi:hypothetical protein